MTDQERITALEARIAQLEARIARFEDPRRSVSPIPNYPAMPNQLPQVPWPPKPYAGWKPGDVWCGSVAVSGDAA